MEQQKWNVSRKECGAPSGTETWQAVAPSHLQSPLRASDKYQDSTQNEIANTIIFPHWLHSPEFFLVTILNLPTFHLPVRKKSRLTKEWPFMVTF